MATNFRAKNGIIGLFTFIRRFDIPLGLCPIWIYCSKR